jgi:hypothetical protein
MLKDFFTRNVWLKTLALVIAILLWAIARLGKFYAP